jgi:DNA-binding CsgD family transcriptional regulator
MPAERSVIGRDAELGAIDEFLGAAARRPAALMLCGEPGIGKTTLWECAVAEARARGHRVLAHRSVQAEAGLAFAGLIDLAGEALAEVADALAPPRRRALEVALLLADADVAPPDPRAIGLAFHDLVAALARRAPVIVALDDIQWLDASSANAAAVALRRLRAERVGTVATLRDDLRPAFSLEDGLDGAGPRRLSLGPLDIAALHRLLRERLGLELARPELARIEEASAGNPFYALELASSVSDTDSDAAADRIGVPDSLRELLGSRLERLPAPAMEVLVDAAACARATPALIAAAREDGAATLDAIHVAERERVVVRDGARLRFAHPLLASLCYEQALPSARRDAHRRLAAVVADPEERARHLALAAGGPDAALATELDAATAHAAARGATAAAADLARLAVERTPPALRGEHRRRRLEAARLCRFAGDFDRARVMYDELRSELAPGPARARVLYAVASIGKLGLPDRLRLCEQALAEADDDLACRAQVLGFRGICRWLLGGVPGAVADARAAVRIAERAGDRRLLSSALARAACAETFALDVTPGLLERALESERTPDRPGAWHENPTFMLTVTLLHRRDDPARARAMLEEVEAAAVDRGDEDTRPWAVMQLMIVEWHAGRWRRALEHGAAARELAEQMGHPQFRVMVARFTAPVQAGLGLVEETRATAAEGIALARVIRDERMLIGTLAALGHLELALGDLEAADARLRDLPSRLLRTGHRNPVNGPWADAIETLIGLGELDLARERLATFHALAAQANAWARTGAERCTGLLATAEGDLPAALDAFGRALAADPAGAYPFERGRALLGLGAAQRLARRRRAARETLGAALALFDELEAPLWARKARAELRRVSGRRPAAVALTEAERRVAALAAQGRKNKEIATELYVSVATVEAHLSRVYRKLGVRSRTELASRALLERDAHAANV